MASSDQNTGLISTETESVVDTHICGSCRGEFNDIFKFLNHKKLCAGSVVHNSNETLRTDNQQKVIEPKTYEGYQEAPKSHDLYSQENIPEPQTESSGQQYSWQSEEFNINDVIRQESFLTEPTQADVELLGKKLFKKVKRLQSHASVETQSHHDQEFNMTPVPILKFANAEERSASDYNISQPNPDHEILFRSKEVVSIDPYLHVQEQANRPTDLLNSVETKSLNTIDNSTPCPEDLEVGQISAVMLGKLSKKFSSKMYPNTSETLSTLVNNSDVTMSTLEANQNLPIPVGEKENSGYNPALNSKDKSDNFITYRNLNTASAPIVDNVSLNLRERRERLPGVSDELLATSSPLCKKSRDFELNTASYGQSQTERSMESSFPTLVISQQREPGAISPPTLTSYKAVFTSPSSAGHRLAPELCGPDLGVVQHSSSPQNLPAIRGDSMQGLTVENPPRRDANTTSYKDISKLIKEASHCQPSSSKSVPLPDMGIGESVISNADESTTSDVHASQYIHGPTVDNSLIEDFSTSPNVNYVKSNSLGKTDSAPVEKIMSVQFIEPPSNDVCNVLNLTAADSHLSNTNRWNAYEVNQESLLPSASGVPHPGNDMIVNNQTVMVTSQIAEPSQKQNDTVLMVIRDSDNNLVMMCPNTEQGGEILFSDSHVTTSGGKDSMAMMSNDESDKKPPHQQEVHFLLHHSEGQHDSIQQQQRTFYGQEPQLLQQHQPQAQPVEYQYVEKTQLLSLASKGVQDAPEIFQLSNGTVGTVEQTNGVTPVQIIHMEEGVATGNGPVPASKSHSFYYAPQSSNSTSNAGVITLDAKMIQSFQSQRTEVQIHNPEAVIHNDGSAKSAALAKKQRKSPKKGKEARSHSSSHKARKDGSSSSTRTAHDPKGTRGRKLASASANTGQTLPALPFDTSAEGAKSSKINERSFNCKFGSCSYKTNSYKDFQRHYRTHTGEKPFKCTACGRSFNRSDKLKTHMRWHFGQKPYQCKLCDYAAVENGSLKKHMRIHNDERPFQCQICPYASRNSSQLIVHLRTHTGDTPFHCSVCPAQFKVNSDLKRHMRIHTGEKPYKCDKCDYRCSNGGNLKTHNRINHSRENEKQCPQCSFASSSTRRLREHIKTHDAAKTVRCGVCQYACNSAASLRSHMAVHRSDRPYRCSLCPHSCKQSGNLRKHMHSVHGLAGRGKIFIEPATGTSQAEAGPGKRVCTVATGRQARSSRKGPQGQQQRIKVKVVESGQTLVGSRNHNNSNRRKRSANCRRMYACSKCECSFMRQDSLRCHLKQHKEVSAQPEDSANKSQCQDKPPGTEEEEDGSKTNSNSHSTSTKDSPLQIHRQGLDHIVAAASQLYQEQYMTNQDGQTPSSSGKEAVLHGGEVNVPQDASKGAVTSQLLQRNVVATDVGKDQPFTNVVQGTQRNDSQKDSSNTVGTKLDGVHSEPCGVQSGNVPWEHSCYTLTRAKSRKLSSSSSTHKPTRISTRSSTSSSSSSLLPSPPTNGQSLPHHRAHRQHLKHRKNNSKSLPVEEILATESSGPPEVVGLSQSATVVKRATNLGLTTGSTLEPTASTTTPGQQPQSSDIQLLVQQQHSMLSPLAQQLPVSAFGGCQSQQPTLAVTHEAMDLGQASAAEGQGGQQTVTFQILPQVATMGQPGSQIALAPVQDVNGQVSLQAAHPLAPPTPIHFSFPTSGPALLPHQTPTLMAQPQTATQLLPQAPTHAALMPQQPQIVFQLTGTNQLNLPTQEVISIATDQTSNNLLGNQTSQQLVLTPCSTYGNWTRWIDSNSHTSASSDCTSFIPQQAISLPGEHTIKLPVRHCILAF